MSQQKGAKGGEPRGVKRKRTRNGCLTCRDRHLKCDEHFPVCNNCVKSKRECLRGIRLKFLNTTVHRVAENGLGAAGGPGGRAAGDVVMLDQSIVTASHYQGGLKSYARYVALHSKDSLKRAEEDFDKYFDVNLASEDHSGRRQRPKARQSGGSSSLNFKNLLNEFLKFESEEFDKEFELAQDGLNSKFNYFEPPLGLETYLEDVKVHTARRASSEESVRSAERALDDYYIFDSDEEEEKLSGRTPGADDLYADPLTDAQEVRVAISYVQQCRWMLDTVTDTSVYDYWLNVAVSETLFRKDVILRDVFVRFGLFDVDAAVPGADLDARLADLKVAVPADVYLVVLTLVVGALFQKLCRGPGDAAELQRYIRAWRACSASGDLDQSDTGAVCFTSVFAIDVLAAVRTDSDPVFNPFDAEKSLKIRATDYELEAMHNAVKGKFEARFEYDSDEYPSDDSIEEDDDSMFEDGEAEDATTASSTRSRRKDWKVTDQTYLLTLVAILGKLHFIARDQSYFAGRKRADAWNATLDQLAFFETNFPYALSPFSISPLKTQATQGLVTMGLAEDSPLLDFASEPPFPMIKCANELAMLIHILHHGIYLYAEKHRPAKFASPFASKHFLDFGLVSKYNEIIPHGTHTKERELLHMARRLACFFLSIEKPSLHDHENIKQFYGYFFDLSKDFLPEEDLKKLDTWA